MRQESISSEIFCLRYELNAMSDSLLRGKLERWVHGYTPHQTEKAHLDRYNFICQFTENKRVLDIACGSGFGSFILAEYGKAENVIGVDLDSDSIKYGNLKYPHPKIMRVVSDATAFQGDYKFDVICCFETIEHIKNYDVLLIKLKSLLSTEGRLFISTPIATKTTISPANPYHLIEWNFWDFQELVKKYFFVESVYTQNISRKPKFFQKLLTISTRIFGVKRKMKNKNISSLNKSVSLLDRSISMDDYEGGYQILVLKK